MRRLAGALLLVPLLTSCSGRGQEVQLKARTHPLVDNLFVEQAVGNFSSMAIASGRFTLSGRCLTVNTGDMERTPVFALPSTSVDLSPERLTLGGGVTIEYGAIYSLPGAVAGPELSLEDAGRCPRETVIVRSIEPDDVPQPKTPPLSPQPRERSNPG